ncbi:type II toxin-antitoxin system HicA family toxin [bacterium]|nr:type II toxin-antitoxin system HicA family toxin [bacterium]
MCALARAGFVVDRQSGSHLIMNHPNKPDLLVIVPRHAKDLKRGLIAGIILKAPT